MAFYLSACVEWSRLVFIKITMATKRELAFGHDWYPATPACTTVSTRVSLDNIIHHDLSILHLPFYWNDLMRWLLQKLIVTVCLCKYVFIYSPSVIIDWSICYVKCTHIPASIVVQGVASWLTSCRHGWSSSLFSVASSVISRGDCGGHTRSRLKMR